ncbi:MAG: hypothetical protein CMM07_01140 [Rhodopirellula sp.]|nr:hypothetical protein [Rhodopirellula sp.]
MSGGKNLALGAGPNEDAIHEAAVKQANRLVLCPWVSCDPGTAITDFSKLGDRNLGKRDD